MHFAHRSADKLVRIGATVDEQPLKMIEHVKLILDGHQMIGSPQSGKQCAAPGELPILQGSGC